MKIWTTFIIIIGASLILSFNSCQKDYLVPEPIVIPDTVSFAMNIMPIFNESCNMSGCHNTGGFAPDLTENNAYAQLAIYGMIDLEEPTSSVLYQRMVNQAKPMPPSNILPEAKIQLVLSWIEQGALDN